MAPSTRVIGSATKLWARANIGIRKVTFMKEILRTIKPMVSACTFMLMGPDTRVTGLMTSSMGMAPRCGTTAPSTLASTETAKSTDTELITGQTDHNMKETGMTTTCKDSEHINGLTSGNTQGTGGTAKCTVKAASLGLTVVSTKELTIWIRSMGTGRTSGQTAPTIKVTGLMGNSKVKVRTALQKIHREEVFGVKENLSNGLIILRAQQKARESMMSFTNRN